VGLAERVPETARARKQSVDGKACDMVGWVLLGALVVYGSCAVATARYVYGVQRAALLAGMSGQVGPAELLERFRAEDQEHTATAALLYGVFWPLTVPAHLAHRAAGFAITSRPPLTAPERQAREALAHDRIQELEQDLGLGPDA
jgi:hypothetical protein